MKSRFPSRALGIRKTPPPPHVFASNNWLNKPGKLKPHKNIMSSIKVMSICCTCICGFFFFFFKSVYFWFRVLYKQKFSRGFYFRKFREFSFARNLKRKNKNSQNIFPSFINERKVCTIEWHASITLHWVWMQSCWIWKICHCTLGNHNDDFNMRWRQISQQISLLGEYSFI